ncbi:MAG: glycosyltransferase family 4 protein [Chloroflexota bacterium]|nr:MAG: glycosyltransferase family 4 protein [Chloroflexota bacterium]
MKILISLMYYRPHYSGLTIYAERLARALASRGHQVTVLTSRYDDDLPKYEEIDGVHIIRPWVMFHISKGVIMPGMPVWAWKLIRDTDIINSHVPQPDAAVINSLGTLLGKPSVLTYHCDLQLPKGFIHYLANQGSHLANHISARYADAIVTNTLDYAQNSPFLSKYLKKIHPIPPPIELSPIEAEDIAAFREKNGIEPEQRIIGMAARLATEKGVEYLVQAMPAVLEQFPSARVLFAGQYQGVLGEEIYANKLSPLIKDLGEHWKFLGILSPEEWSVFFHEAEVSVLPSINSTESFGMVQVESMFCGTPVVATDLPGVRQPVLMTGMGLSVPPKNHQALSEALIKILSSPNGYGGDRQKVINRFSSDSIAAQYESLFERIIAH